MSFEKFDVVATWIYDNLKRVIIIGIAVTVALFVLVLVSYKAFGPLISKHINPAPVAHASEFVGDRIESVEVRDVFERAYSGKNKRKYNVYAPKYLTLQVSLDGEDVYIGAYGNSKTSGIKKGDIIQIGISNQEKPSPTYVLIHPTQARLYQEIVSFRDESNEDWFRVYLMMFLVGGGLIGALIFRYVHVKVGGD